MKFFFLFASFFLLGTFSPKQVAKISLHMDTKRVFAGKRLSVECDIFYKPAEGKLVMHYSVPENYILVSNKFGEAKIYYPDKNKVSIQQSEFFSSENNLLYYFISDGTYDMGLKSLGFQNSDTRFEDDLMITTWLPPVDLLKKVSKVELVYKNYLPIYTAYFDKDNKITKKMFYSAYAYYNSFSIPLRVTEIDYQTDKDSIVSRMIYSDVKTNEEAENQYFDFQIPENAQIMENK